MLWLLYGRYAALKTCSDGAFTGTRTVSIPTAQCSASSQSIGSATPGLLLSCSWRKQTYATLCIPTSVRRELVGSEILPLKYPPVKHSLWPRDIPLTRRATNRPGGQASSESRLVSGQTPFSLSQCASRATTRACIPVTPSLHPSTSIHTAHQGGCCPVLAWKRLVLRCVCTASAPVGRIPSSPACYLPRMRAAGGSRYWC